MKEAEGNKAHPYLEEFYDHWEDTKVAHKISANKEHKLLLGRALIRRPQVNKTIRPLNNSTSRKSPILFERKYNTSH